MSTKVSWPARSIDQQYFAFTSLAALQINCPLIERVDATRLSLFVDALLDGSRSVNTDMMMRICTELVLYIGGGERDLVRALAERHQEMIARGCVGRVAV